MRRKIVYVSVELLTQIFMENHETKMKCIEGLPSDVKFIRGFYEGKNNVFGMIFEHPDWDEIEELEATMNYPVFTPVFHSIDDRGNNSD